ncbi:MAG: SsrA-binding protein SmpB [Candidatus Humimicrobiaceae bacterium]
MAKLKGEEGKIIAAQNKKAFHDFLILDKFEAGIILRGNEVKSIREHKVNLTDSYARVKNGEIFLYNMYISPYSKARIEETNPLRIKKLLMHKQQILKINAKMSDKSLTLVPLSVYFDKNFAKVELGLAKAKLKQDKRQDLAEKATEREIQRTLKNFSRS